MELNNFGAVLRFAIELEDRAAGFYEDAARNVKSAEAFFAFAQGSRKCKGMLERARREMVSEMMLEPITGFEADLPEMKPSPNMGHHEILRLALELEEDAYRFYLDAASKISSVAPSVSKIFSKVAQEKAGRKLKLESLHD